MKLEPLYYLLFRREERHMVEALMEEDMRLGIQLFEALMEKKQREMNRPFRWCPCCGDEANHR